MTILLNALLNFQCCIYKNQANEKALSITIAEIFKKCQYLLKSAFITSFSESSLLFVGILKWFMKESYFLVIRIQKIFYILTVTEVMEIFTTSNGNFHHRENFASEVGFATHCKQKIFQVQHRNWHKLHQENAYLRSFLSYNGTVAQ